MMDNGVHIVMPYVFTMKYHGHVGRNIICSFYLHCLNGPLRCKSLSFRWLYPCLSLPIQIMYIKIAKAIQMMDNVVSIAMQYHGHVGSNITCSYYLHYLNAPLEATLPLFRSQHPCLSPHLSFQGYQIMYTDSNIPPNGSMKY